MSFELCSTAVDGMVLEWNGFGMDEIRSSKCCLYRLYGCVRKVISFNQGVFASSCQSWTVARTRSSYDMHVSVLRQEWFECFLHSSIPVIPDLSCYVRY